MLNIVKKLCNNWSERQGWVADSIVIHISAGSLWSMTDWFSHPESKASAHYGISKNGIILMYVEESKSAWTCGNINKPTAKIILERPGINPNRYTINIENEGMDLRLAPDIQRQTLYKLILNIATRNKIPIDREHIIGHYEIDSVNRCFCPSPDHTLLDKIVESVKTLAGQPTEEMVNILVPKSKVALVQNFINSLK